MEASGSVATQTYHISPRPVARNLDPDLPNHITQVGVTSQHTHNFIVALIYRRLHPFTAGGGRDVPGTRLRHWRRLIEQEGD